MLSIDAVSIAPAAGDWLRNSCRPRFLHVFDHACNLVNERGEVLSIVTSRIGNGPFNLVIEDNYMFPHYLDACSPIFMKTNQIKLGDLTIDTSTGKLWFPQPDWRELHAMRNEIFIQLLSTMNTYKLPFSNYREASLWDQSPVSNLSSAFARADIQAGKTIASQLAGLGQGLTPSGDDFLMGAIYALWIIHPPEIASAIAKEIASHAAPLTTSLSAAWLRCAGGGEAGILWHDLFHALIWREDIQFSITNLLFIGETSGADALAGFLAVFGSWAGREIPFSFNQSS